MIEVISAIEVPVDTSFAASPTAQSPKEQSPTECTYDFSKYAAGSFLPDYFAGETVDFFLSRLYDRAAVPMAHSLRAALKNARTAAQTPDLTGVPCVPSPFPAPSYDKPLVSIQDWLDCLAAATTKPNQKKS